MSDLSVFFFKSQQVCCVGTAMEPESIAADICAIFSIDTSVAVNLLFIQQRILSLLEIWVRHEKSFLHWQ